MEIDTNNKNEKHQNILQTNKTKSFEDTIGRAPFMSDFVTQTRFVRENARCISNNNAVHRVKAGTKCFSCATEGISTQLTAFATYWIAFLVCLQSLTPLKEIEYEY
jgi:hypothetical protein